MTPPDSRGASPAREAAPAEPRLEMLFPSEGLDDSRRQERRPDAEREGRAPSSHGATTLEDSLQERSSEAGRADSAEAVDDDGADMWASVPGQADAVRCLSAATASPVHAYLLIGPRGSGKRAAAAIFAGELIATADPRAGLNLGRARRHRQLAVREQHPDVFVLEPTGNQLRREGEAALMIAEMSRTPVEGRRKVIIVDRFHTATAAAAACLLKPIEEPAESAIWILLAERVPPEHTTIASRCSRIDFATLTAADIEASLTAEGLANADRAALIATASAGNLRRARMLAADQQVEVRYQAWRSIPDRIDGTGATVAQLVEEVRTLVSDAAAPLDARHKQELAELAENEKTLGAQTAPINAVKDRHRREQRQHRTDELRFGLSALAGRYRERIASADDKSRQSMDAISKLRDMSDALIRNPNEALALQALLLNLPVWVPADDVRR